MDVIWARGQEYNAYHHNPRAPSGFETGTAQDEYFYRQDELKYHGHGGQRGRISLNFHGN